MRILKPKLYREIKTRKRKYKGTLKERNRQSLENWIIKRFGSRKNFYRQYLKPKQTNGRLKGKHITPLIGENNPNWKGGISSENNLLRTSAEYKNWRKSVFERDGYKCQICGQVGGELEVHHIKPFSIHPELRFVVDNGITLCKSCHHIETNKFMRGNKYAHN